MKKTLLTTGLLGISGIISAQSPAFNFSFDGQSLSSSTGGYTLTASSGTAAYSTAVKTGNGTHAAQFNGSTILSTPFTLDSAANAVSYSLWVKRTPTLSPYALLLAQLEVHKPAPGNTVYPGTFTLSLNNNHFYTEWYLSNTSSSSIYSTDTLIQGWNFVTVVWHKPRGTEKNLLMYVNGKLSDSATVATAVNFNGNKIDLTIGGFYTRQFYTPVTNTPSSVLTGELDEVKMYYHELDSAGVRKLYEGGVLSLNQRGKNQIRVYPNPARDIVQVETAGLVQDIAVLDLQGRILRQIQPKIGSEAILNLEGLASGTYLIRVSGGNQEHHERLIICR